MGIVYCRAVEDLIDEKTLKELVDITPKVVHTFNISMKKYCEPSLEIKVQGLKDMEWRFTLETII